MEHFFTGFTTSHSYYFPTTDLSFSCLKKELVKICIFIYVYIHIYSALGRTQFSQNSKRQVTVCWYSRVGIPEWCCASRSRLENSFVALWNDWTKVAKSIKNVWFAHYHSKVLVCPLLIPDVIPKRPFVYFLLFPVLFQNWIITNV